MIARHYVHPATFGPPRRCQIAVEHADVCTCISAMALVCVVLALLDQFEEASLMPADNVCHLMHQPSSVGRV